MLWRNLKFYLVVLLNAVIFIYVITKYKNLNEYIIIIDKNKLNLDERSEPTAYELEERIADKIPNLPIEDLETFLRTIRSYNFTCAWYPGLMDIQIQNEYWQILHNKNLTYNIFGAYLDTRPLVTGNKKLVRILAMIDLISVNASDYPATYCQFWFRKRIAPLIVRVKSTEFIWRYVWGHDPKYSFPHILTCVLPKAYKNWIPKSVSLVAEPCDKATNNLRVIYKPLKSNQEKKEFAVCIKGLHYPFKDLSYRFVEYIEALRSMGAQKVTMYSLMVHENITKVLNYYQRSGFLEYRPFSYSLKYSNLPEYRHKQISIRLDEFILHEGIVYNDCIYRNMYRFKYIAVWDIDELAVPLKNNTSWQDLVKVAEIAKGTNCKSYASYCFLCAYFPSFAENPFYTKEFPVYFYMLQHIRRVKNYAPYGSAMKCLHNSDYIIATHNHLPVYHAAECMIYTFNTSEAQLNHYREPPFRENLTDPVIDKNLLRFSPQIMQNSLKVFDELDFFARQ